MIANASCANQILAVTGSGGFPPYEFSKDGGITWTSGSSNPYQFTSVSGVLDPWVKDASGSLFRADQIDCGQLSVTFQPIYLNANAGGAILAPDTNTYRYAFTVDGDYNDVINVSGVPDAGTNTTFVGWSYSPNEVGNHLLTTNQSYAHTIKNRTVVYGLFKDNEKTKIPFCLVTGSATTMSINEKANFCSTCPTTASIWFSSSSLNANGNNPFLISPWYKNEALTTLADNGFYKSYTGTNSDIFIVNNGVATFYEGCDPAIIENITC